MSAPSTVIQWTMPLADAALIHETLITVAEQLERQADYLASGRYAETQRAARLAKPKEERGEPWKLSTHDQERIVADRARAERLRRLAES